MKEELKKIFNWFEVNKLKVNFNKTNLINFSTKCKPKLKIQIHIDNCNKINCQCIVINQIESTRYLGVEIQQDLKWRLHINKINSELRKMMHIFKIIKNKLFPQHLIDIFFALTYSKLIYGIALFGGTYFSHHEETDSLLRHLIQIIDPLKKSKNKLLQIQKIKKIYILKIMKLIYQNKIMLTERKSERSLRIKQEKEIPKTRKEITRKSVFYLAPKIYNQLQFKLKTNETFYQNKIKIIEVLININDETIVKIFK